MSELSEREKRAVANAIVALAALANHSLSPTQTRMARRSAGELLWLMKIDSCEFDGRVFNAAPPVGEILDIQTGRLITHKDQPHG